MISNYKTLTGSISSKDNITGTVSSNNSISGSFIGGRGPEGRPGKDGKTAYDYAVEGGFTGTEAEFSAKLSALVSGDYDITTTDKIEQGNMHPITSNAVHTVIGNVELLLSII